MRELVNVTTQADLERAVADGNIPVCRNGFYSAYDSATVRAYGSATVRAYGSATVEAYGSATVEAYGSATVEAYGSATVRAYDSATVRAYGSATVEAYGSATVRAYDSATVEAYDSATVRASGSATVRASGFVAVTRHGTTAKINGGVLIQVPDLADAANWIAFYGLTPKRGKVTVYKAVNDSFTSGHGTTYSPGDKPKALDWDGGLNCCGGGLHFSPRPHMALTYSDGRRFVACAVKVSELLPISRDGRSDKCKAPACTVLFECDIDGAPIAETVVA